MAFNTKPAVAKSDAVGFTESPEEKHERERAEAQAELARQAEEETRLAALKPKQEQVDYTPPSGATSFETPSAPPPAAPVPTPAAQEPQFTPEQQARIDQMTESSRQDAAKNYEKTSKNAPDENTIKAQGIRKEITAEINRLKSDPSLTAEQRAKLEDFEGKVDKMQDKDLVAFREQANREAQAAAQTQGQGEKKPGIRDVISAIDPTMGALIMLAEAVLNAQKDQETQLSLEAELKKSGVVLQGDNYSHEGYKKGATPQAQSQQPVQTGTTADGKPITYDPKTGVHGTADQHAATAKTAPATSQVSAGGYQKKYDENGILTEVTGPDGKTVRDPNAGAPAPEQTAQTAPAPQATAQAAPTPSAQQAPAPEQSAKPAPTQPEISQGVASVTPEVKTYKNGVATTEKAAPREITGEERAAAQASAKERRDAERKSGLYATPDTPLRTTDGQGKKSIPEQDRQSAVATGDKLVNKNGVSAKGDNLAEAELGGLAPAQTPQVAQVLGREQSARSA